MISGQTVRDALAAVGAVGKQLRSFDELAAGADAALRQAPPGLTVDGAAAFLATCAVESAWFRTTVEYGSGQRYAPFVGRTFVQLTWEANYRGFGKWCHGRGLVEHPDVFVRSPITLGAYDYAWLGATYYFEAHDLWRWANPGDFRAVSQAVNGGNGRVGTGFVPNGWTERQAMYAVFRRAGAALLPDGGPAVPATSEEDDDMFTDADRELLRKTYGQLIGPWGGWDGGSVGPDGRPFSHTLVDWARRTDVHIAALHRNLNDGVHRKLDRLLAEREQTAALPAVDGGAGGARFTADEVRTLIREALADLGPLHLTTTKESP